jgi:membrane associated rhomboid family serine protease
MFWASFLIIAIIIACIILSFVRAFLMTVLFVVANIAVFIILLASSSFMPYVDYSPSFAELGLNPAYIAVGGSLYTLITSMFMHLNMVHLAFNMMWFAVIGLMLEERTGKLVFGSVFFITGIIGGITFAIAHNLTTTDPAIAIGASGALYGVFGSFVRLYPFEKMRFYFFELPAYIWFLVFLGMDMLLGIFQPFYNLFGPIAYSAHIGGLASGFLLVPYIAKLSVKPMFRREYKTLEPLAKTQYLREILDNIGKEDDPTLQGNWLDEFLKHAECPRCGSRLSRKMGKVICEKDGFALKF